MLAAFVLALDDRVGGQVRQTNCRICLIDFLPAGATGPVTPASEERLQPGALIGVDRGGIHQLANTSQENLVTVHVYAPPLSELVVYSTIAPDVERRPLRYTLAQDLA